MDLVLRDTLTGNRRAVRPPPDRPVAMYVCGPTVYDRAHVGHARTYLYFDVARRFLEAEGRKVLHIMNVTDFEDKLDVRAAALGVPWRALARREERGFFRDLADLGTLRPTFRPRASAFVPDMIRIARRLERTGRVRREGAERIYTAPPRPSGANFPTDRELATHAVQEPGHPFPTRTEAVGEFMVWRRQERPKPSWPSPWGRGIPGWHLECYAMAERLTRVPVDLHGGGLDLIYPHHHAENEIALALRGTPFSRVFLHTAFVLAAGAKMSKSTGNLVPLRDALDAAGAGPLRWYLLRAPYSQRVEWDPRDLAGAVAEFRDARSALAAWQRRGARGRGTAASAQRVAEGVRRDIAVGLGVDRAIARLKEWTGRLASDDRAALASGEHAAARRALREIEARTGLPLA
jgi:cysteinyl-tRNA synthetase